MAKQRGNRFLRELSDDFLECRGFRHAYERLGSYYEGKEFRHVLQCKRCDTYALLLWDEAGQQWDRGMVYSEGYLNTTGEKFERSELRQEVNRRTKFKGGNAQFDALVERIMADAESRIAYRQNEKKQAKTNRRLKAV